MKCTECGSTLTKTVGDYHYVESGLDNVMLQNVPQYTCETCGAKRVTIGAMAALHRAIAKSLAEKPARLVPNEIAFLRDHLDLTNKEFADLMGVSAEQASRWTNSDPIGVPAERLLRVLTVLGPEGVARRRNVAERYLELAKEKVKKTTVEKPFKISRPTSDEIFEVVEHFPPRDAAVKEVEITIRRGKDAWMPTRNAVN